MGSLYLEKRHVSQSDLIHFYECHKSEHSYATQLKSQNQHTIKWVRTLLFLKWDVSQLHFIPCLFWVSGTHDDTDTSATQTQTHMGTQTQTHVVTQTQPQQHTEKCTKCACVRERASRAVRERLDMFCSVCAAVLMVYSVAHELHETVSLTNFALSLHHVYRAHALSLCELHKTLSFSHEPHDTRSVSHKLALFSHQVYRAHALRLTNYTRSSFSHEPHDPCLSRTSPSHHIKVYRANAFHLYQLHETFQSFTNPPTLSESLTNFMRLSQSLTNFTRLSQFFTYSLM